MYISVRNACLNYNRNSTKIAKISLSDNISEINIEDTCLIIEEEVHRLIQNEIDRLPDAMKQIFNLTLAEMSVKEIAQTLHISENTVRNQRTKARKILRNNLKDKIFLLFL